MKTLSNEKDGKLSSTPFSFPAPAAREVSLAGDFNNWDPKATPMFKGADGVWHLSVALKPGRHEYRFVADGVWRDDPAAQQKSANAMGGENCVKMVSDEIIAGQTQQRTSTVPRGITL